MNTISITKTKVDIEKSDFEKGHFVSENTVVELPAYTFQELKETANSGVYGLLDGPEDTYIDLEKLSIALEGSTQHQIDGKRDGFIIKKLNTLMIFTPQENKLTRAEAESYAAKHGMNIASHVKVVNWISTIPSVIGTKFNMPHAYYGAIPNSVTLYADHERMHAYRAALFSGSTKVAPVYIMELPNK